MLFLELISDVLIECSENKTDTKNRTRYDFSFGDLVTKTQVIVRRAKDIVNLPSATDGESSSAAGVVQTSEVAMAMEEVAKVSVQLRQSVTDTASAMSVILEKDRLEGLAGHVDSLKLAHDLEDMEMLRTALVALNAEVQYTRQRLEEGKREWIGPWVVASSVSLMGMERLAKTPKALGTVAVKGEHFRHEYLNFVAPDLFTLPNVPWVALGLFIEGEDNNLHALIAVENAGKTPLPLPPQSGSSNDTAGGHAMLDALLKSKLSGDLGKQ